MSYDGYETIRFERKAEILTVVLDNPASEMNEVDSQSHSELARLFCDLREEREAKAVVLTGTERGFISPGTRLDLMLEMRDPSVLSQMGSEARRMILDLLDVEVPLVAAMRSDVLNLGVSIALLCDAIFLADDAVLRDTHAQMGLVAGDGGAVIWPLIVGPALAKRFLMTGDPVGAEEAERLGLVTHVVARSRVLEEATAFAARLAASPGLSVRWTKQAVNRVVKNVVGAAFDAGLGYELVTILTGNIQHGFLVESPASGGPSV